MTGNTVWDYLRDEHIKRLPISLSDRERLLVLLRDVFGADAEGAKAAESFLSSRNDRLRAVPNDLLSAGESGKVFGYLVNAWGRP
jgi:hypothetical protein